MNSPVSLPPGVEIIQQPDRHRWNRTVYGIIGPTFDAVQTVLHDFYDHESTLIATFSEPKFSPADNAYVSVGSVERRVRL